MAAGPLSANYANIGMSTISISRPEADRPLTTRPRHSGLDQRQTLRAWTVLPPPADTWVRR